MNMVKRLPAILVSAAIAVLPIVLIFQPSVDEKQTPQLMGGMGIATVISLGLGALFFQFVWKGNPKTQTDAVTHICCFVALACFAALICVLAVMAWPPSAVAVFVILWESAFVFVKPINDSWFAPR